MKKTIKIEKSKQETIQRAATMDRAAIKEDARTVELSFSSEEPYLRYHWEIGEYYEVLSHEKGDVDMDFISSGNAPLLSDHYRDVQIGKVESAEIGADRKGRAIVRFGNKPAARDEWEDVKDGIRANVSVGYRVSELVLEKEVKGEPPIYRAKWEPLEVSLVSIPADRTVGVGKSETKNMKTKEKTMPEIDLEKIKADAIAEERARAEKERKEREEHDRVIAESRAVEAKRVKELREAGAAYNRATNAQEFIDNGKTVDEFYRWLAEDLAKTDKKKPMQAPNMDIGMTAKDVRQYSFYRLIESLRTGRVDGFEREISDELAKRTGKTPRGAFIPPFILAMRDLNTTDDSALIGTDHMADRFIEALRNRMVLAQAGITILTGLSGNVSIPRRATTATLYWVTEGNAPTESESTFDTVTLGPKCCGTYTDITRSQQLQSSPDVEMLTRVDLLNTVAVGLQVAALHGGGSSEPTGIAGTSGIGSVAGGTNGAAPDWADIVSLETEVAQDDADLGSLAYITNAKVRGKLKQTFKNSTYGEMAVWQADNTMNGYPALCTNSVSSALTKGSTSGTCSAIFFGNWSDLLMGMWGVPDLLVDPYTASAAGTTRVRILQDIDIAVRHAVSFSAMLDAITT